MKRDLLFQPLALRSIALRNRIVMSAMTRERSPGGVPGPAVAAYYRRRAEGEAGLIITEGVGIDEPAAVDSPNIPVMHGSAALAGWRGVVQAVHAAGGVIFPQLWHQGVLRVPGVGLNNGMYDMHKGNSSTADNIDLLLDRFDRDEFDLVAVGRSMLGDPQWARRVRLGEAFVPFDKRVLDTLT